ncbi:MAG: MoaD/ThiS family protein [Pseudomonadota bacterium]|nr:MoaD/ThiS family protein [Pseudomonadota bacterium]
MPVIHLPAELRSLADGQARVELPGERIRDLLAALYERFPDLEKPISNRMAVAIDGTIVNHPLNERLSERSEVHVLTRIAGG